MQDYYEVLGVPHTASAAEIRSAYRKKAKKLHPDITHQDSEAFRNLVKAYETLSNIKSRELFDQTFAYHDGKRNQGKKKWNYREWLLARDDDESRAKLILFDLTHEREDSAVAEFKRLNMSRADFRLSYFFEHEIFMDYGYILAEELIIRQEYYDAVLLLDQIIRMEQKYNYFKFFFEEVLDLTRSVLRNNIEGNVNDELAIDAWERALELGFGKKDDAFFLLKMSDAYERIGDPGMASACRVAAGRVGQKSTMKTGA